MSNFQFYALLAWVTLVGSVTAEAGSFMAWWLVAVAAYFIVKAILALRKEGKA